MRRRMSLKLFLTLGFVGAALLPALAAGISGVLALNATLNESATTTITEHGKVASTILERREQVQSTALAGYADHIASMGSGARGKTVDSALEEAAHQSGFTFVIATDRDGRVIGSSESGRYPKITTPIAEKAMVSGKPAAGLELVPAEVLDRLGKGDLGSIQVVETKAGTAHRDRTSGSMSIISAIPLHDRSGRTIGTLVGYEVLARSTGMVDDIVDILGGTATLFQDEIRISTTVLNDSGQRAIGTVSSDLVQDAVLKGGKTYIGEAVVVGKQYMTDYQPLRDPQGRILGMLYVGIPLTPYNDARALFAWRFLSAVLACAAIAWGIGVLAARFAATPVIKMREAASTIAAGDLTAKIPESGLTEIGALADEFHIMSANLSVMIMNIQRTIDSLRGVSSSVVSSASQQAATVNRQVAAATQTTATLEEMAVSFRAVAQGADEVKRVAEEALEVAHDGQATLQESMDAVQVVHTNAGTTAEAVAEMEEVAQQIGEVLTIIDSIAEQTKILALNAAIEASRAGEAGKGFGVVAAEIRALADSVSHSTARIDEMVRAIQGATNKLAGLAASQYSSSDQSVEMGSKASEAFNDILEQLSATTSAVREIAKAASEQQGAAEQVVMAMQQVTTAAGESKAAAEDIATAAAEVDSLENDLERSVQHFRI